MSVDLAQDLYLLLAALGLAVPVTYAGMPILGQGAFVAMGAFGTALLGPGGVGWPVGFAVLAAIAMAAAAGWLVGLGAGRLESAALGLSTWAFAWLGYAVLLAFPDTFGGAQGLVRDTPAQVVSPSLGVEVTLTPGVHVVIASAFIVAGALLLRRVEHGPGGLDLAALREGPQIAASLGVPLAARRRTLLAVAAAVGALGGCGAAVVTGVTAAADYSPLLSLELLVAVLVVALPRWWAPLAGVVVVTGVPRLADDVGRLLDVDPERGRGLLAAVVLCAALALRAPLRRRFAAWGRGARAGAEAVPPRPQAVMPPGPVLLSARSLRSSYGALRVLDGVDIDLRAGQVHAVIGPNGSGKTTLLRVLAGSLQPEAGEVLVAGTPDRSDVVGRVALGIARTPQRTVLVPGLSAAQQVAVGARGGSRPPFAVVRHLLATPRARAENAARARVVAAALAECGLAGRGGASPASMGHAEQRLLQVARAVATGARVLLLDEPAAGMTVAERSTLVAVLRRLAAGGAAVLVVEHDLALVSEVSDRVTALVGGRAAASGDADEVRADPVVRAAYLGVP